MTNIDFSIIIPSYNRAEFILETIYSALNQNYESFEVLFIDDGSTDNTKEKIATINNQKFSYFYKDNGERAAARNYGIKQSHGKYICFLDSDDILLPHHLQTAIDFIKKTNTPEQFHLNYKLLNKLNNTYHEGYCHYDHANEQIINGNFLSCNGVFLRKDIAENNLFNEDRILSGLEDWELWLRLCAQYNFPCVKEITSVIINHEERSVLEINPQKLIDRILALIKHVEQNKIVVNKYNDQMNAFRSSCYSYISLHLLLGKKYKKTSFNFLLKSISQQPSSIFKKRFLSISKKLLF